MDQTSDADVFAGSVVQRHLRPETQLDVFSHPDQAGIEKARGGSSLGVVQISLEVKFDYRKHAVERRPQADILDGRLQVGDAVHDRESVAERGRETLFFAG